MWAKFCMWVSSLIVAQTMADWRAYSRDKNIINGNFVVHFYNSPWLSVQIVSKLLESHVRGLRVAQYRAVVLCNRLTIVIFF